MSLQRELPKAALKLALRILIFENTLQKEPYNLAHYSFRAFKTDHDVTFFIINEAIEP